MKATILVRSYAVVRYTWKRDTPIVFRYSELYKAIQRYALNYRLVSSLQTRQRIRSASIAGTSKTVPGRTANVLPKF